MRNRYRVAAALSVVALTLTAAACSSGSSSSGGSAAGKTGGDIVIRGCTPENPLIGGNTNEVCGGDIVDAIAARLVHYNVDTAAPEMDVAESIETADNVTFTVKLKQDRKFDDGTDIKAKNFVDAWNHTAYGTNGYKGSYFFEPVEGYADTQCGTDCQSAPPKAQTLTGLTVVDDYTFTIKTSSPVSNLPIRLGYVAFSAQPDAYLANPEDAAFGKVPVAGGPFKVVENTDTQIVLEKSPTYTGANKPRVDKVTFKIYQDSTAAYTDVVANNLDYTNEIPTDRFAGDIYKTEVGDRSIVKPVGVIQTITFSSKDEQLKNAELRRAISMAIDRETIVKQVFNNTRQAADSFVSPVVDGYKADQCGDACKFNATEAKKLYEQAGGYQGTFTIAVNGDADHKTWAQAVCNDLTNNLGMQCVVDVKPDFKTLRQQISNRELKGSFRTGWQMDYPSIENFLAPLYGAGAASNDGDYNNPAFDQKLRDAAAATDPGEANRLYQEAELILVQDLPVAPLWFASEGAAWSNKVTNVKINPFGVVDLTSIALK